MIEASEQETDDVAERARPSTKIPQVIVPERAPSQEGPGIHETRRRFRRHLEAA